MLTAVIIVFFYGMWIVFWHDLTSL
jgi:hypothetical protein